MRRATSTVSTSDHALDGPVDGRLERDALAAAQALVGGDDHAAAGVEDAVAQGLRREAAEDHRVDGADAGAGEHHVGGLGDHVEQTIWRHESGPGESRLPSGPIDELSDVTSASKLASSGGFVTCAKSCLKYS